MDGEENNFRGRCNLAYLVCSLDAIHDRHIDVEKNEVRMQLFDLIDSLLAIFSFAANVHGMPGKKRADGLPRYLIIVHDQNPDRHLRFPVLRVRPSGLLTGPGGPAKPAFRDATSFKKPCRGIRANTANPLKFPNNCMDGHGPAWRWRKKLPTAGIVCLSVRVYRRTHESSRPATLKEAEDKLDRLARTLPAKYFIRMRPALRS